MPIQTSYTTAHAIGTPGQLADSGVHDIISGLGNTSKRVSVALTAVNSTLYTVTINGVAFSYTSDGSATTAEIAVGLAAAINAGTQPVVASGTDTPLIIQSSNGTDSPTFTSAYNGNMVETVVVAGTAPIPFGVFVCRDLDRVVSGPEDYAVRLPRVTGDVTGNLGLLGGVTLDKIATEQPNNYTGLYGFYGSNTMVNVLRDGRVLVLVEEAVTISSTVFVRFASGTGGTQLGAFRASADSATAVAWPLAKFTNSAAAGGLAVLEVSR
jgi:hypothetical protein